MHFNLVPPPLLFSKGSKNMPKCFIFFKHVLAANVPRHFIYMDFILNHFVKSVGFTIVLVGLFSAEGWGKTHFSAREKKNTGNKGNFLDLRGSEGSEIAQTSLLVPF
jgi:hypothetical protein